VHRAAAVRSALVGRGPDDQVVLTVVVKRAAAELAARRFIPVAGGQQVLEIGGLPTTVTQPSRVFDSTRGVYVDPPAPQGGKPAMTQAPKAGEVRGGFRYMGGDPALPESWKKVA